MSEPPSATYLGLREQALRPPTENALKPNQLWAVVMDWPVAKAIASVVAVADGTTSIYLSSGGGYIGGGQSHIAIRDAGRAMLLAAGKAAPLFRSTTEFPLPSPGEIYFYAVTVHGVATAQVTEKELTGGKHALLPLSNAAQNVITQYRMLK